MPPTANRIHEISRTAQTNASIFLPPATHIFEYIGNVNHETNQKLFSELKLQMQTDPSKEIVLTVSSSGGTTGAGMCFYDMMRFILRPDLTTVGTGDVDSSGVIILLSGFRRYVSKHTTMLLHMAGRTFDPYTRFTTTEMQAMLEEDKLKDKQYAQVIADNTHLSAREVLEMMKKNTVLEPKDIVRLGFAHALLG